MSQWQVIIPVKRFSAGKSRIRHLRRTEYARAFALDTISAAAHCGLVGRVIVVTDEPTLNENAFPESLSRKISFHRDAPAGLNPALNHSINLLRNTHPHERTAILLGDLPALRPSDLGDALYAGVHLERAFVRDAEGTGTTLLQASKPSRLVPAFGPGSATKHEQLGYVELRGPFGNLARDVDTTEDLARLKTDHLASHTRSLLDRPPVCGNIPLLAATTVTSAVG